VIAGFEATILSDESIHCCEEYSRNCFIGAASIQYLLTRECGWETLKSAIQNPPNLDVIIGHLAPEPTFDPDDGNELSELASLIVSNCKVIELNARYHRPPLKELLRFKEHDVRFHFKSDAHSTEEIVNLIRLYDLIAIVDDDNHDARNNSRLCHRMRGVSAQCAELGFYS
jgi:histidinol phosphatase-like PHP family hydrolase